MDKSSLNTAFAKASFVAIAPRIAVALPLSYMLPELSVPIWSFCSLSGGMAVQRAVDRIQRQNSGDFVRGSNPDRPEF